MGRCRLQDWLDTVLWEREDGTDIMRLKGLVNIGQGMERKVVQAVQEVYDIHNARPGTGSDVNEIVIIGRNLNYTKFMDSLKQCVEPVAS